LSWMGQSQVAMGWDSHKLPWLRQSQVAMGWDSHELPKDGTVTSCHGVGQLQAGLDLPIGCISLSLGPQDPTGPPTYCGRHRVNGRYMIM